MHNAALRMLQNLYLEWVAILGEVFSQNVQHPDHLGEDQDSVASFSESGQQLVQQHQLPAAPHQTLKCKKLGCKHWNSEKKIKQH